MSSALFHPPPPFAMTFNPILANATPGGICHESSEKSRHLNHKVMNLTRHPITLVLDNLETGRWSQVPQPAVAAFSSASHCSCNRNNEVTGTTGSYVFRLSLPRSAVDATAIHVFYVACFFSNPLMGSFKAGIKVYGHEPSRTLLLSDYSLISTSRTDVTFGTDQRNLFTAVSVPGSQVVFEIREQNHLGAGAPLLPPPCRWANVSFPGDEPWPARFVFRRMLEAQQKQALPSVGPRRDHLPYHLSVATVNFEQLPRGVDIADTLSQLLATVNVVALVNALEGVAVTAVEAMQARGVTTVQHEDLLVFCEFPIVEHQVVPFRATETLLANHATAFVFFRLLLPQGGACSFILTRLQSSTRPTNHAPRRLSLGSPTSDLAHYTETAATRYSQTLELAAYLRAPRLSPLLTEGVFVIADTGVHAPPCRGPEFVRQSHAATSSARKPTGRIGGSGTACACQCCACEYGTLRDVLWRASGADACVDLFYDSRMEGPVAQFLDVVKVAADPLTVDPVVVQGVMQGDRTRVMFLGSRAKEWAERRRSSLEEEEEDADQAAKKLRQLEIGLERIEVDVKVPIVRRRRRGSLAAVVLGADEEVVGVNGAQFATYPLEVKVVHIADRSARERKMYVRSSMMATGKGAMALRTQAGVEE